MSLNNIEFSNLCLVNGNIITMDPTNPKAEAVLIRGGTILRVGFSEEIKAQCDETTKVIDLAGKTVLPGLHDTHIHLLSRGILLQEIELREARSIEEIKEKVREEAGKKAPGAWITGRGWNDNIFVTEKRFPTRFDLDQATPDHPVALRRVCGHIVVANSMALEIANITAGTQSPPGGQIDKDPETNEPTGILREDARNMVQNLISYSDKEYYSALKAACELALSKGITTIHCLPTNSRAKSPELKIFQKLYKRGDLPLRVYLMIPEPSLPNLLELGISTGFGNSYLKIGGIKVLLDGSFGGHTAAMMEPYNDQPDNKGILIYSEEQLHTVVKKAHNAGFQLGIHTIGDRAARIAIDAIEAALEENPREDSRHRLEHASTLSPGLIQRMKKLGMVAAAQPPFIKSDGDWVPDRLGDKRSRYVYPFKTMITAGIKVAAGSDCPVELMDPFQGIQDAVTRVTVNGTVFVPEERVSVEQALRMYTLDAAYGAFEEHIKGSIEPGKFADMIIVSDNPFDVPTDKISEIEVAQTIVGGKIVYTKK
ncbi:MAG: amidohydrolase [Candidatus Heimdallarchaeota archaeon]